MGTAYQMIDTAYDCGADYAKFQKRNNKELLTLEKYNRPYTNPNSYGETYGKHREYLEFTQTQHGELKEYCESVGIGYSVSVWDTTSTLEMIELNPDYIKIPSAKNNKPEIIDLLKYNYNGDIHVSLGMTTISEENYLISQLSEIKDRVVLYACTSCYPTAFEDVCLLELSRLASHGFTLGFSGHHLGIAIDIIAARLGAEWIERHFTLDRTWRGSDHAASLEPTGLSKLVRDFESVELAWKYKPKDILDCEMTSRKKLKGGV
jgi:N-acetylneuraminate synthase